MFRSILALILLIASFIFEPTTAFLPTQDSPAKTTNTFDIFGEEFHYNYNYQDDKENDNFYDSNKALNEEIDLHFDVDEGQDQVNKASHFILDKDGDLYDYNDESFYNDFVDEQSDLKDSLVSI